MLILKWLAGAGAGVIVKLFRGIAGPILEHYQAKDVQVTARQGIWANALVGAAMADVENRRIAAEERGKHPILMALYVGVIAPVVFYWMLFWLDTIFAGQIWRVPWLGWTVMDWVSWDLPRAPQRLEEMGKEVLVVFLGGGSAVYGVTKAANIMKGSGLFRGK